MAHTRVMSVFPKALCIAGLGFMNDDRVQPHVGFTVGHVGESQYGIDQAKNTRENCSALGDTGISTHRSECLRMSER